MSCPVHDISNLKGLSSLTAKRKAEDRHARRVPYYGPYSRKARQMRQEITEAVARAVEANTLPRFAEPAARQEVRERRARVREYVEEVYQEVGRRFARENARSLSGNVGTQQIEQAWTEEVGQWVLGAALGGALVAFILSTLTKDLVRVIDRGVEEGESTGQIASRLRREMQPVNKRRGRVIARTEVAGASNKGAHFGALRVSGAVRKEWVNMDDDRVRLSHRIVDGNKVRVGDLFRWNSPNSGQTVEAKYPHDPRLPGPDRYRCRCILTYTLL
jgi:uncharacterized protein with gpF-like domain